MKGRKTLAEPLAVLVCQGVPVIQRHIDPRGRAIRQGRRKRELARCCALRDLRVPIKIVDVDSFVDVGARYGGRRPVSLESDL